jgi:hypothetical protein
MNKHLTFLSALALTTGLSLQAQNVNQMVIQANKIGAEIQPTMYGHFFEDINYGADGEFLDDCQTGWCFSGIMQERIAPLQTAV